MQTITDRQREAAEILGDDLKHPRIGSVLALTEELGELVKEVMEADVYGLGTSPELLEKMGEEAADILFSLFEVCTAYNIDLETAYDAKVNKIRGKLPLWREKYSESLRRVRAKLD